MFVGRYVVSCFCRSRTDSLDAPGPVAIATTGQWDGKKFGLKVGPGPDFNHAKIGVSGFGPILLKNSFSTDDEKNSRRYKKRSALQARGVHERIDVAM